MSQTPVPPGAAPSAPVVPELPPASARAPELEPELPPASALAPELEPELPPASPRAPELEPEDPPVLAPAELEPELAVDPELVDPELPPASAPAPELEPTLDPALPPELAPEKPLEGEAPLDESPLALPEPFGGVAEQAPVHAIRRVAILRKEGSMENGAPG